MCKGRKLFILKYKSKEKIINNPNVQKARINYGRCTQTLCSENYVAERKLNDMKKSSDVV